MVGCGEEEMEEEESRHDRNLVPSSGDSHQSGRTFYFGRRLMERKAFCASDLNRPDACDDER
jgi:hypothetical protein